MDKKYFKLRNAWKPINHKFDLGGFIKINPVHASGYFVMRIFKLKETEYLPFYKYHLKYYLENNTDGSEQAFLTKIIEYIDKDIRSREILHYYKTITKTRVYKLSKFREAIKQVDKWEVTLTNEDRIKKSVSYVQDIMDWQNVNDTRTVLSKLLFDEVGSDKFFIEYKNIIEERDQLLTNLAEKKLEIQELKKAFKAFVPKTKIQIMDGDYLPLVDLLVQLSTLKNPSTGSPYLSASQDTWASLISNYFEYCKNNKEVKNDETNLKWATVRDYFLENNRVNLMKSKNRHKFFHIKESDRVYN